MTKKDSITAAAISANLTTMTPEEQDRLQRGLELIPVHKVINLIQYLQNNILPQVLKRNGEAHQDYKNFSAIINALVWSVNTNGYHERLMMELSNERMLCEFYRNKCLFYERELTRYTTQEDLLYGETFLATSRALTTKLNTIHEHSTTNKD
jgi:hypothetical protein